MDAHHNEYLAAVAGLRDQTITPPTVRMIDGKPTDSYAVGSRVRFVEDGRELLGVVVEVVGDTRYHVRRHVPDHGNEHHVVDVDQILPF